MLITDKIRAQFINTPDSVLDHVAKRFRFLRQAMHQSRKALADDAGVSATTIRRFEDMGHISLKDLIALAVALNAEAEFGELFPKPASASIDQTLAPPTSVAGNIFPLKVRARSC